MDKSSFNTGAALHRRANARLGAGSEAGAAHLPGSFTLYRTCSIRPRSLFRLRESVDQLQASRERDVGRDGHAVRRHGVPHKPDFGADAEIPEWCIVRTGCGETW